MRTESGEWAHRYDDEERVTAHPPQGPYAVYLADERRRFRFVVFDLDAKKHSAEQVREDAAFLAKHLDQAGLAYLVAASGSPGGIHLWVPVVDPRAVGAPARLVARIAHAAAHRCPTVDKSALLNPSTGCVRPPGAPHRNGGYSRLIEPQDPMAAAAYADAAPNTLARLKAFAEALGPVPEPEDPETAAGSAGIIDTEAVRLVGRRRPMPSTTAALLAQAPEADASAHLARILTGLALARWSLADVLQVFAERPHAPGFEHVRTQAVDGGRRPRSGADQRRLLTRQWGRQVAYAARLPRRIQRTQDTPEIRALVETVWCVQQTTEIPTWWRPQSGPSDAKALHFVATMALEACTDTVEIDGRRLADRAGMVHSTAARALARLVLDGRLALVQEGEGRRSHTYRLVLPEAWAAQQVRVLPESQGGTQATPAPADVPRDLTRQALLDQLTGRLDHAAHDVWTEPRARRTGGLGRHVETTAAALAQTPNDTELYTIDFLVRRTGYRPHTIARHLHTLASWHLVATDSTTGHLRTRPDRYDDAARALDVAGTRARRMARYEAERLVWAAWTGEVEALRAPRGSLAHMTGRRRTRYPRTRTGRPDHAAARAQALAAAA
ncbi:non-homologous end-joining DNA ligase LigD [Nocardiopsis deserti]|uniref:non-homologous end-joining DNA ligase LigD n=1 Tax=Nocardiopsis deserti TaxID=2605988 RepID=UPI00123944EE|nr:hypothetical protein [Nocardiopsis deserti]